jgi:hypothetical protein
MKHYGKVVLYGLAAVMMIAFLFPKWNAANAQGSALQVRDTQVLHTWGNIIHQYVYENGVYKLAWQSADLGGQVNARIGDIDNDGIKEIVASVLYSRSERVKGKNVSYYDYQILVFENGVLNNGGPSWQTARLGERTDAIINDSCIADVNNDGINKLVMLRSNRLEVYKIESPGSYSVEVLKIYPSFLFSLGVGDADNLGGNEIVAVSGGTAYIWKHQDTGWREWTAEAIPPQLYGSGMTSLTLTYLKVKDADNLPGNEIIATGNNQRLMVWKYQNDAYKLDSYSPDLNADMAYGIDSGDIMGTGFQDVAINLWGTKKLSPRVVILRFENGSWVVKNTYVSGYFDQRDLRAGNLDTQIGDEIVLLNGGAPSVGLKILKFVSGAFQQVFSAPGVQVQNLELR